MTDVVSLYVVPTPMWPLGMSEVAIRLWGMGFTTTEMADYFGKTLRAMDSRIRKLRVDGYDLPNRRFDRRAKDNIEDLLAAGWTWRDCLYCLSPFLSPYKKSENRLCGICIEHGPFTSTIL